jgi:hypothetical protein
LLAKRTADYNGIDFAAANYFEGILGLSKPRPQVLNLCIAPD